MLVNLNAKMAPLGKVYEHRPEHPSTLLDGVYFSMYDFRFYDSHGHLLNKPWAAYSTHQFELGFDFGECTSPSGEHVRIEGRVITPLSLSELIRQPEPATPKTISVYQQTCYTWMAAWGFNTQDPIFSKATAIDYALISIVCAPDIPLERQRLQLIFWIVIFLFDDIMDNFAHFNNGRLITIKQNHDCTEVFCTIMKGGILNIEGITIDYACYPYFIPLCNALLDYRQETLKASGSSGAAQYFIDSWVVYMRSVVWGTADTTAGDTALDTTDSGFITRAYFFKRSITIGIVPNFELICLLRAFSLAAEIREHPLFSYLNYQLSLYTSLVNDTVSLKKELINGETENFALLHRDHGTTQQHVNEAVHHLNNFVVDYNEIAKRLLLIWPDDDSLQTYVAYGRGWMIAQWQWMTLINRYGVPPLDCHIIL
ncbi:terpene synthase family protein [Pseudomonas kitaguniensis]|uniref:terpene synthase family protein n=1 Tax=Pseudomonas kitaguniensis TaxID=2607908 RepID=UPI003D08C952